MSVLVLFGAGASSFSDVNLDITPPLGNNLFEKMLSEGGVAATLPPKIKKIFKDEGFEAGMAVMGEKYDSRIFTAFQRQMALHLAKYNVGLENCYVKLIRSLGVDAKKVTFASLNYDILLEQAIFFSGMIPSYNNYIDKINNVVKIIKIHGSCNLLPVIENGNVIKGDIIKGTENYIETGNFKIASSYQEIERWMRDPANCDLSPILSLYAKGKNCLTNWTLLKDFQDLWSLAAAEASLIILIGVRYVSEDIHIWDAIGNSLAKVAIVNTQPQEILDWSSKSRVGKSTSVLAHRFSDLKEIESAIRNEIANG